MTMIILIICSPFCILLIHAVLSRVLRQRPPQMVALNSALLSFVPVGFSLWLMVLRNKNGTDLFWAIAYCVLVYGSIAYTYFHFYNMSETARRIRILYEIYRAGRLPSEDMTVLYKTADIVSARLKRLVAMKQVKCVDGYYSIEGKTLYVAGISIFFWRRVLNLIDDN